MTDHSVYLAENFTDYEDTPGFPYLRLHPAIISADYPIQLSTSEEQILLAMHSTSENLLVVSNKKVLIYKIPRYKSFIKRVGVVGVKTLLRFIPGVGVAMEIADKLGEAKERLHIFGEVVEGLTGKAKKERAEDLLRAAEGMPTKKELENLTWDIKDENILALILCYRDKILLENGFEWKVSFQGNWENTTDIQNTITMDSAGIKFHLNRKNAYVKFPRNQFDPIMLTGTFTQLHQQALASAGWSLESDSKKFIFKDIR